MEKSFFSVYVRSIVISLQLFRRLPEREKKEEKKNTVTLFILTLFSHEMKTARAL